MVLGETVVDCCGWKREWGAARSQQLRMQLRQNDEKSSRTYLMKQLQLHDGAVAAAMITMMKSSVELERAQSTEERTRSGDGMSGVEWRERRREDGERRRGAGEEQGKKEQRPALLFFPSRVGVAHAREREL